MKFIELTYGDSTLSTVLFVIAGIAFLTLVAMIFLAGSKIIEFSPLTNTIFVVLMAVAVSSAAWATLSMPSGYEARKEQLKEVKGEIQDRYGISLSKDEVRELDYPLEEPEKDFEVFGTVTRNVELKEGFERQEVSLLWRDGRFELAQSNDGQGFNALRPRGGSSADGSVSDEPFFAPSSTATEKSSND